VSELDRTDGDIDTLVARIASVRTWTYVANRSTWLDAPREWQEKTRALEDRLSDALHERLVMRFVDVKKGRVTVTSRARPAARRDHTEARSPGSISEAPGIPVIAGHPFAKLAAMRVGLSPREGAVHASAFGSPAWVEGIVEAKHEELRLEESGRIVHVASGRGIAEIVRGPSIALPDVRLIGGDELGAGAQRRLHRRVLAFARDVVAELMGGARDVAIASTESSTSVVASSAVRGLVFRLEQGLGTVLARDVADVCAELDASSRAALVAAGLHLDAVVVYVTSGLTPKAIAARLALATLWYGAGRALRPPSGGAVSFPAGRGLDHAAYTAIGFPVFGPRAVRADVAARVHASLADSPLDTDLASWLGCPTRDLRRLLTALTEPRTSVDSP
jgi:ATP-dependent RNA helicase SUPV3L1/SUV3